MIAPPAPSPLSPPQLALRKVLQISRLNGWSVATFAGLCALVSLVFGDLVGGSIGLLVVGSGAMEIHGHRLLKRRDGSGMIWLIRAQFFFLGVIWAYAVSRLFSFDGEYILSNLTSEMEEALKATGVSRAELVPLVQQFFRVFYGTIMFVTLLYQGGLAFFYQRKSPLVLEALAQPPAT